MDLTRRPQFEESWNMELSDEDKAFAGIEFWLDASAFHERWDLCITFKWRLISQTEGGIGYAWPIGLENGPNHYTHYYLDVCYGLA